MYKLFVTICGLAFVWTSYADTYFDLRTTHTIHLVLPSQKSMNIRFLNLEPDTMYDCRITNAMLGDIVIGGQAQNLRYETNAFERAAHQQTLQLFSTSQGPQQVLIPLQKNNTSKPMPVTISCLRHALDGTYAPLRNQQATGDEVQIGPIFLSKVVECTTNARLQENIAEEEDPELITANLELSNFMLKSSKHDLNKLQSALVQNKISNDDFIHQCHQIQKNIRLVLEGLTSLVKTGVHASNTLQINLANRMGEIQLFIDEIDAMVFMISPIVSSDDPEENSTLRKGYTIRIEENNAHVYIVPSYISVGHSTERQNPALRFKQIDAFIDELEEIAYLSVVERRLLPKVQSGLSQATEHLHWLNQNFALETDGATQERQKTLKELIECLQTLEESISRLDKIEEKSMSATDSHKTIHLKAALAKSQKYMKALQLQFIESKTQFMNDTITPDAFISACGQLMADIKTHFIKELKPLAAPVSDEMRMYRQKDGRLRYEVHLDARINAMRAFYKQVRKFKTNAEQQTQHGQLVLLPDLVNEA